MKKLTILLLLPALLIACHKGGSQKESFQVSDIELPEAGTADGDQAPPPPDPGNGDNLVDRKLIKVGSLEYKTSNLEEERRKWQQAMNRWKAYAGREESFNYTDRRSLTWVVRVPAAHFDSLLAAATLGVAYFDRKEIEVKDVTEEYVDVAARLKTKKELEQRYLELLKKAYSVKDVLEIEREIGALRADIESIEGRLQVLQNQVAYATLSVTVYEVIAAPSFFGSRVAEGFVSGWNLLLDFLVGVTHLWPFALLVAGGWILVKRYRMRRRINRGN